MNTSRETTRMHLDLDGNDYVLSSGHDMADLMSRIESTAAGNPAFIDLATRAGLVSVLITASTRAVIYAEHLDLTVETAPPEDDWGDWEL